ncbi:MAG: hypothetical protein C4K60_21440 [Ideonella sp. MAG2]|nr:MAG: hypothetical protein C4K60_21440 [Ideonella sp. MAG2]
MLEPHGLLKHRTALRSGFFSPIGPAPVFARKFKPQPAKRQGARAQRVALVIEDAGRGEPIQALSLECPYSR